MNARDDRLIGPGPPVDPNPCEFHTSDTWVVVDALIAIVTALATIFVVAIRHPFRILSMVILIATIGTIAGWWTP
jgi:hypothetical protein